jgi:hypothetical protein
MTFGRLPGFVTIWYHTEYPRVSYQLVTHRAGSKPAPIGAESAWRVGAGFTPARMDNGWFWAVPSRRQRPTSLRTWPYWRRPS